MTNKKNTPLTAGETALGSEGGTSFTTGRLVALIATLIVLVDQIVKFYVKTHFYLGESVEIFPWWEIKFIENNGMAFGIELWNKYLLTFGRIIAVGLLIWCASKLSRIREIRRGFMVALGMIIAGAAGNIFDCVFYGEIFNNPMPPEVAQFLPDGGGYAPWFQGRVVDMLYFPLFSFTWPEWMPGVGGENYEFFQYIFNIADASICIGVFLVIFFYSKDTEVAFSLLSSKKEDK